MSTPPRTVPLRTVSLRRRVTFTALAAVSVVLIGVVVVVNALFGVVANRGVNAILTERVQLAEQLARQNARPQMLIKRMDVRSVRARLVLADGEIFGSLDPLDSTATRAVAVREVRLRGTGRLDGAVLTLAAESGLLSRAQSRLLWVLVVTGLGALLVTVGVLVVSVRYALAPLDAMTALARQIARGGRGRRLSPARTDTELGRTAAAFDAMLDALEGAESQARASEERTRRFVADAAHELRTPIAGIAAAAEAVLQAPDTEPEQRQRLELLLVRESHRAARLVDDLVDLARLDAGVELHREPVELRGLAAIQADRVRVLHPALTVALHGEERVVDADAARVSQILANLLDNACHATPASGRIDVAVGRHDSFAEVLVSDTGPGVPAAERERIFDRLVRLDAARDRDAGGSGLGLPIAHGFARAHGGDLRCQPPPPGATGAVFQLLLPLASGEPPADQQ